MRGKAGRHSFLERTQGQQVIMGKRYLYRETPNKDYYEINIPKLKMAIIEWPSWTLARIQRNFIFYMLLMGTWLTLWKKVLCLKKIEQTLDNAAVPPGHLSQRNKTLLLFTRSSLSGNASQQWKKMSYWQAHISGISRTLKQVKQSQKRPVRWVHFSVHPVMTLYSDGKQSNGCRELEYYGLRSWAWP